MKLATLSRSISGVLSFIALTLAAASYWGWHYLREPVLEQQSFTALRQMLRQEVMLPLSEYLRSGDPLELRASELALQRLIQPVDPVDQASEEMPPEQAPLTEGDGMPVADATGATELARDEPLPEVLQQSLAELAVYLETEARAAGKLAGNTHGLIVQNERDTRDELSRLDEYAREGAKNNAGVASQYRELITRMTSLVFERSLAARQISAERLPDDETNPINQQLLKLLDSLANLPRLGVAAKQEVDDFALLMGLGSESTTEKVEDKAEDIIAMLRSLLLRYPKDLENTQAVLLRIRDTNARIGQYMQRIELDLGTLAAALMNRFEGALSVAQTALIAIVLLIVASSVAIDRVQRGLASRIREFVPKLKEFASGNLTGKIHMETAYDELVSLRESANALRSNLSALIEDIQAGSQEVDQVSEELGQISQSGLEQMNDLSSEAEQITRALTEMVSSFQQVAERAANAAQTAKGIDVSARGSLEVMNDSVCEVKGLAVNARETSEAMDTLGTMAKNIDSVLEVIMTIASQTNLLALNAAIEAARAGSAGRGFAVVADEVRQLAIRTGESTEEIRQIIDDIQKQANNCISAMQNQVARAENTETRSRQAEDSLNDIAKSVSAIAEVVSAIAVTTEEQAAVAEDINRNLERINVICAETLELSKSSSTHGERLKTRSKALVSQVSHFHV